MVFSCASQSGGLIVSHAGLPSQTCQTTSMAMPRQAGTRRGPRTGVAVAAVLVVGAAVGVAVYLVGRNVTPDYKAGLFGQHLTAAVRLKAQLATVVLGLALLQLVLALWMYGRLPGTGPAPRPVALTHRAVGFGAFVLTIPITVHCIQAYGVELTPPRGAVHSLAACFFYGAFAAKVLVVQSRRLPGWLLPVTGGALVVAIAVIWYLSALWYFNGDRLPGF
jgi:hypothetical protein